MPSLTKIIRENLEDLSAYHEQDFKALHKESPDLVDAIFIRLTGYTLHTLLKAAQASRYTELSREAKAVAHKSYLEGIADEYKHEYGERELIEACLDCNDDVWYNADGSDLDNKDAEYILDNLDGEN